MSIAAVTDGRVLRGARTRSGIVQALLDLLNDGVLAPTAAQIADRAGVSVRSVFQHFDDLETLYAAVGARVTEQLAELVRPVDMALGPAERVVAFCQQRGRINEALTPTLRAAVVHAPGSPTINSQFQAGHDFVAARLAEAFAPELDRAGDRRELVLDSLVAVGSWSTWNSIRTLGSRGPAEAELVVANLVASILGDVLGESLTAAVSELYDSGWAPQ